MYRGEIVVKKTQHEKKQQVKTDDIVASHVLVPKHIKISEKEKKEVFEKYHVSFSELPKIRLSDPALKGLDVKPGDVIKIIRNSKVAGKSVYYRGVINE